MKKKIKAWIIVCKDSGEEWGARADRKHIFRKKVKEAWLGFNIPELECVKCVITYEVKKRKKRQRRCGNCNELFVNCMDTITGKSFICKAKEKKRKK